jgi:hypothetical protein
MEKGQLNRHSDGLDDRRWIPVRGTDVSLLHRAQTGFEAHPTFFLMGTGGPFLGSKGAGV